MAIKAYLLVVTQITSKKQFKKNKEASKCTEIIVDHTACIGS